MKLRLGAVVRDFVAYMERKEGAIGLAQWRYEKLNY